MNRLSPGLQSFLSNSEWLNSRSIPLRNDASRRQYWRLTKDDRTSILMDSSNDDPLDFFIKVAVLLQGIGLRTPKIYYSSIECGYAIIEDFGDRLVADILKNGHDEKDVYTLAVDKLRQLQSAGVPDWLPPYDNDFLRFELEIYLDYALKNTGPKQRRDFFDIWDVLFDHLRLTPDVIVHRDYHVENLVWMEVDDLMPDLGVLDFQGARQGPIVYDLVSLLEDARRNVPEHTRREMLDHFLALHKDLNRVDVERAYAIVSAQRNLKILGIFERLAIRDGKTNYRHLIPHVRSLVGRAFQHPVLNDLVDWYRRNDPAAESV